MKKDLIKFGVLTLVLTTMTVSTAFANVKPSTGYQLQQQQFEQIRQQNEALKQQNTYLMQQTEMLKQQTKALKQSQLNSQAQINIHPVQTYVPAPAYTSSAVYYAPAPVPVYYSSNQMYSPGPWYGGLAAGYILGHSRCGFGWGHRCGHWRG